MKYRRDMCGEIVDEKAVVVCLLVGTESKFKLFGSNDENYRKDLRRAFQCK